MTIRLCQLLYVTLPLNQMQHLWHFPSYTDTEFKAMIKEEWEEYSRLNEHHMFNLNLFWEASKVHIRGRIISYKRLTITELHQASTKLRQTQKTYTHTPSLNNNINPLIYIPSKMQMGTWLPPMARLTQLFKTSILNSTHPTHFRMTWQKAFLTLLHSQK